MKVVFRVDSSTLIGMGHLTRSLVLANLLRLQGAACHFICRAHEGHQAELPRSQGFEVSLLPVTSPSTIFSPADYTSWLGASVQADVQQTINAICVAGSATRDWLVVDHYGADVHWQRALHPHCRHLMVVDDLTMRMHDCSLLLNQSLGDERAGQALDPGARVARLLLGPKFALLRPEFEQAWRGQHVRNGPVRRILIAFGGSDAGELSILAANACAQVWPQSQLDIVISAASQHFPAVQKFAEQNVSAHVHSATPTIDALMASADFSVGAAGMMTWERCATGLPAALVVLTENQQPIAEFACRMSAAVNLGMATGVSSQAMVSAFLDIKRNESRLQTMSLAALKIVDGLGARRVVSAMEEFK